MTLTCIEVSNLFLLWFSWEGFSPCAYILAHLQVAREVYNNCVRGAISQKTRILVTNQLQFVAGSDRVLFMAEGRIAEAGTYNDLMKAGKGFAKLMQQAEVRRASQSSLPSRKLLGIF